MNDPKELDELINTLMGGNKSISPVNKQKENPNKLLVRKPTGFYRVPVSVNSAGTVLDDETKFTSIGEFNLHGPVNTNHPTGVHEGVDLQVPLDTPVYAAGPGTVTAITNEKTSPIGGNTVWIKHTFDPNLLSYYAHLNKVECTPGDVVDEKTVIGLAGKTGNARFTSVHVHFQFKLNGTNVNPRTIFGKPFGFTKPNEPDIKPEQLAKAAQIYKEVCDALTVPTLNITKKNLKK